MRYPDSYRLRIAPALLTALSLAFLIASPVLRAQDDDSDRPHLNKPQSSSPQSEQQSQPQSQQEHSASRTSGFECQDVEAKTDDVRHRLSQPSVPADQPSIPNALPRGKKLILTDGSFHLVRGISAPGGPSPLLQRGAVRLGGEIPASPRGLAGHTEGRSGRRGTETKTAR